MVKMKVVKGVKSEYIITENKQGKYTLGNDA